MSIDDERTRHIARTAWAAALAFSGLSRLDTISPGGLRAGELRNLSCSGGGSL